MHPRLLLASASVCAWAWAYLALEATGQVYMVSREMDCVPSYENSLLQPTRSKIFCSALCLSFQCLAFAFSDGECDIRGVGFELPAETRVYTKFSLPLLSPLQMSQANNITASPALHPWYTKENAIDGNSSTIYHSDNGITHPWWMIDLEVPSYVFSVDILPGQKVYQHIYIDIQVRVGFTPPTDDNFSRWLLLGFYKGRYSVDQGVITFTNSSGLCGQYVVVQRISSDFDQLQLTEVLVFAKNIL
ncbi:uncharacterized protein LOC119581284 [Penaeus monodon]|uniref:uncharacterized protein LOC119581284 n=1 Tax=Penaeus monodon TaxID=6687 RepID=UPI0018A6F51D|nr:uncharacterized protein LOC119581284 [Penaeus monodon]